MGGKVTKLYYIADDDGSPVSYHATREAAATEQLWWKERGNEVTVETLNYVPTKRGVAALLNVVAVRA